MGSLKTGHDGSSGPRVSAVAETLLTTAMTARGAGDCGDGHDDGHDGAGRWRLRGRFLMPTMTACGAGALAVAGMLLTFPVPASAQEKGAELLLGAAGPGLPTARWGGTGPTGAVTWWFSDRWGVAGWYWAADAGPPWEGAGLHHTVAPAIRWRKPLYGGRTALHVGFTNINWSNLLPENGPGGKLKPVRFLVVDAFVAVPLSPSLGVRAGGLWLRTAFLPMVGLAWTF